MENELVLEEEVAVSDSAEGAVDEAPAAPAKKRGRPRIHPVKVVDPNAPKRGRGRPKKVVEAPVEEAEASAE